MGEQNNTESFLCMKGSDGEWVKLTEVTEFPGFIEENYNVVPLDGEIGNGMTYHMTPTELEGKLTFTVKYPKQMRCKSRKRYIKLLMSRGIERNLANELTKFNRFVSQFFGRPYSYQSEWSRHYWILPSRKELTNVH